VNCVTPESPRRERLAWLTGGWAVGLLLVGFYGALVLGLRSKSATLDEPGHALAGYTYWKYQDFRLDPENGNFTKRWITLPLLFGNVRPPAIESATWENAQIVELFDDWFYGRGNDASALLARGRAASAVFAVALGLMIWWWSRRIFGRSGGMLSLLLYICNPGFLANGGLMTSDTAAALMLLVSLYCFWRMLESPTSLRVLMSGVAIGVLFLTKMSAITFVPVALVLAAARILDPRPLRLGARTTSCASHRAGALGLLALIHIIVIILVIWSAYGFRYSVAGETGKTAALHWEWAFNRPTPAVLLQTLNLDPNQTEQAAKLFETRGGNPAHWSGASRDVLHEIARTVLVGEQRSRLEADLTETPHFLPLQLVAFAREHRLLPEAFIYGFAHLWMSNTGRIAFLNGHVRVNEGFRWFFPFAFLVKTPLALFGIMLLAAAAGWTSARATLQLGGADPVWIQIARAEVLPLVVLLIIYGAATVASNINIGHRHLLPLYPPLIILCGAAAAGLPSSRCRNLTVAIPVSPARFRSGALLALLLAAVIEAVWWFPDHLAYFNGLVRPSRAYRHLVDSSLDWGQDLPALRTYLDHKHPVGHTYLALYGRGPRPDYYGITATRFFYGAASPILVVPGISPQTHAAPIADFFRSHPEFDPKIQGTVPIGGGAGMVFLRRSSELRLGGGTYFIGATCVQPLHPRAPGPWNASYEARYQRLRSELAPLLSDEPGRRLEGLGSRPLTESALAFQEFDEFRGARLTAWLRKREPDDNINYSILVYHLTEADVIESLEGPPP
jgi:hypothetical protein